MRVGNLDQRLVIIQGSTAIDVEHASGGKFGPDPQAVYDEWDAFAAWAQTADLPAGTPFEPSRLGAPTPAPRQVFAIGLNYREHASESGFDAPEAEPPVFTKFPSCITGPYGEIVIPAGGEVDWEVELVAVIGRTAFAVSPDEALDHVAGYAVGQDISERKLQFAAMPPQFSLGKSLPGFGPIGPWLVTLDEFADPNALRLSCAIDGETVQDGSTADLIFPVAELVAKLSASTVLMPGDVIFTGTPSGVGVGRSPKRFLAEGEELVSRVEGIGELRHRFVSGQEN